MNDKFGGGDGKTGKTSGKNEEKSGKMRKNREKSAKNNLEENGCSRRNFAGRLRAVRPTYELAVRTIGTNRPAEIPRWQMALNRRGTGRDGDGGGEGGAHATQTSGKFGGTSLDTRGAWSDRLELLARQWQRGGGWTECVAQRFQGLDGGESRGPTVQLGRLSQNRPCVCQEDRYTCGGLDQVSTVIVTVIMYPSMHFLLAHKKGTLTAEPSSMIHAWRRA